MTRSMGMVRSDYEYGNIALLYGIAEKTVIPVLKDIYPTMWDRIISYVMLTIFLLNKIIIRMILFYG
jgi:transposase